MVLPEFCDDPLAERFCEALEPGAAYTGRSCGETALVEVLLALPSEAVPAGVVDLTALLPLLLFVVVAARRSVDVLFPELTGDVPEVLLSVPSSLLPAVLMAGSVLLLTLFPEVLTGDPEVAVRLPVPDTAPEETLVLAGVVVLTLRPPAVLVAVPRPPPTATARLLSTILLGP